MISRADPEIMLQTIIEGAGDPSIWWLYFLKGEKARRKATIVAVSYEEIGRAFKP